MIHYTDYLPRYLDGKNINRHAAIIEDMDLQLYNKIETLSEWMNITRPILIEKIQDDSTVTIKIHITSSHSIKSITVTGDYIFQQEYPEKDIITDEEIEFTIPATGIINPNILVVVETYDEVTYTKGYPENDTAQGDFYDHDEFLDRIGRLMGLPRRMYKSYPASDMADAYPPYFAKDIVNNVVQSCTEDDYYYSQRLQYFIDNYMTMTLPELMLRVKYHYMDIEVVNCYNRRNDPNMTDRIERDLEENPEKYLAGMYLIILYKDNPVNIDSLTSEEKENFIKLYTTITRDTTILEPIETEITLGFKTGFEDYWKREQKFELGIREVEVDTALRNALINYNINNRTTSTARTSNNDTNLLFSMTDVPRGYNILNAWHPGYMEYAKCTAEFPFKHLADENLNNIQFPSGDASDYWYGNHTITDGVISSNNYMYYTGIKMNPNDAVWCYKLIVRSRQFKVGFINTTESMGNVEGELTGKHYKIARADEEKLWVVRLYSNYNIEIDGIGSGGSYEQFDASKSSYIYFAPLNNQSYEILSMEFSQLESLPMRWDEELLEDQNIYYLETGLTGWQEWTLQIDVKPEDTMWIGLTRDFRNVDDIGYIVTSDVGEIDPEDFTGTRFKLNLKCINGVVHVYTDYDDTGIRWDVTLYDGINLWIEPPGDGEVYDVAYAPVTDIQEQHTLMQPIDLTQQTRVLNKNIASDNQDIVYPTITGNTVDVGRYYYVLYPFYRTYYSQVVLILDNHSTGYNWGLFYWPDHSVNPTPLNMEENLSNLRSGRNIIRYYKDEDSEDWYWQLNDGTPQQINIPLSQNTYIGAYNNSTGTLTIEAIQR